MRFVDRQKRKVDPTRRKRLAVVDLPRRQTKLFEPGVAEVDGRTDVDFTLSARRRLSGR